MVLLAAREAMLDLSITIPIGDLASPELFDLIPAFSSEDKGNGLAAPGAGGLSRSCQHYGVLN
jgi:hypothetical protein